MIWQIKGTSNKSQGFPGGIEKRTQFSIRTVRRGKDSGRLEKKQNKNLINLLEEETSEIGVLQISARKGSEREQQLRRNCASS